MASSSDNARGAAGALALRAGAGCCAPRSSLGSGESEMAAEATSAPIRWRESMRTWFRT